MECSSNKVQVEQLIKDWGIGLTGPIATGKSTVAQILRQNGFWVIDADKIARHLLEPNEKGYELTVKAFGPKILDQDGIINRPYLRELVFSDVTAKKKLEKIIHPLIHESLLNLLASSHLMQNPHWWFYEAALLIQTGFYQKFHQIWLTRCSTQTQIQRLIQYRGLDEQTAIRIMNQQQSVEIQEKYADLIIDTDCSLEQLTQNLTVLCASLKKTK